MDGIMETHSKVEKRWSKAILVMMLEFEFILIKEIGEPNNWLRIASLEIVLIRKLESMCLKFNGWIEQQI